MIAITNRKRTIYDCNYRIFFARFVQKSKSRDAGTITKIAIIFGPHWNVLQSYMVRFRYVISIIFSPFYGQDCDYIWFKS